jgi:DNA-directed RNA polymerase I subunit RPA12
VVDFCPECNAILYPKKKEDGTTYLICKACHYERPLHDENIAAFMLTNKLDHSLDKTLIKDDAYYEEVYGKQDHARDCPRCGAKMIMQVRQTRRADEGPTIFYTCIKCNKQIRIGS